MVNGITTVLDYDQGMDLAKKAGKPILLDFNGYACVNCRKMEDFVWTHPEVYGLLKNNFVIISLYVDDKTPLPEKELGSTMKNGKEIKTYGDKWMNFQVSEHRQVTQPLYVIMDGEGNTLNGEATYDTHRLPSTFATWLSEGLKKFKSL